MTGWIARAALIALAILTACGGSEDKQVASSATPAESAAPATPPSVQKGSSEVCPHTGLWARCSVERRLRQAGFVLKPDSVSAARRSGFSVDPEVYTLGASRLELFLYPNSAALARDIAAMDTLSVAPATLIRSANLAAVLLSKSQRQAERLTIAITAGPPQPGSPR